MWFPENPRKLRKFLAENIKPSPKKIKGIIVPHAGYQFSGRIAAKAFELLPKTETAIVFGPSHYLAFEGVLTAEEKEWQTPLGKVRIMDSNLPKIKGLQQEHSINNQIPFLQYLNPKIKILPIAVGEISWPTARQIARQISKIKTKYIFSTDLSHFHPYEEAELKDKKTIKIIASLNKEKFNEIEACGYNPLKILFELCKILKTAPRLIEYKNSGDITGQKDSVVGYASFWF